MVHPDYQYSPLLVPAMASMIAYGEYDMVLGSRILAQNSVARGMPRYKYVANRFLTFVENIALSQKLSEYHTGLRAFSSELLGSLPFERNSDDFVFDNQIIAQAVAAGRGSARSLAPPAMRPTRHRSTCGAASATASACCSTSAGLPAAQARAPALRLSRLRARAAVATVFRRPAPWRSLRRGSASSPGRL